MNKKIIIFGPQGSGKGTQAQMIAKKYKLAYISPGEIFRQEMKCCSPIGMKMSRYVSHGKLVPDTVTNAIMTQHIKSKKSFILDGFPRNTKQQKSLSATADISHVIVIEVSDKEAIARIAGRLTCSCGKVYHKEFNPPKKKGVCDTCSKKLFVREDDKPQAIKKRLKIYHQQTQPLYEIYEKKGIVKKINGEQPIQDVYNDIVKVLR